MSDTIAKLRDLLLNSSKAGRLRGLLDSIYGAASTGAEAYGAASSPMSAEHSGLLGGLLLDMSPLGDAKSAYDGVQSAREGDWLGAGLGGLGALPMMPNLGGVIKKIPAYPGTTPVPDGFVRLYHQTEKDAAEAIGREGLLHSKAKGIEGPRSIYADEKGFYGSPTDRPTVEFFAKKDKWDAPFVLEDIPPNQILGVHLPWHERARYMLDKDNKQTLDSALSGQFDNLDGDYAEAVKYVKGLFKKGQ